MNRPNDTGHSAQETALLVCVDFNQIDFKEDVSEAVELVESANVRVIDVMTMKREKPDAAHFIGTGKVDEIASFIHAAKPDLVIVNHALTPTQERNLSQKLQCRVVDRTALILDIFAQRAKTHEGQLQVELAQLTHLSTRLIGVENFDRQKSGMGSRGPGEKKLETDRRLIADIKKGLILKLKQLEKQRETQRKHRRRNGVFTVAIVGYTNAGKSTLFNGLSKAKVYAADQLFATLDTTTRQVFIHEQCQILMSDTVGFIRHLPTHLIEAFRATLEETIQADVLLHVVDASNPMKEKQIEEVNRILADIGADNIFQCLVLNKVDLIPTSLEVVRNEDGLPTVLPVSARTGYGIDMLKASLALFAGKPYPVYDEACPTNDPLETRQSK
jgi:GTP-binding protein HflX